MEGSFAVKPAFETRAGEFWIFTACSSNSSTTASTLLKEPVSCILIIPSKIYEDYYKNTCLNFSGILINYKNIPREYTQYIKKENFSPSQEQMKIRNGIVNSREWEKEYINSAKHSSVRKSSDKATNA